MAKKFLIAVAIMSAALLTIAACGRRNEMAMYQEAISQIEDTLGVQINPLEPTPQTESEEAQENDISEIGISLNLPLSFQMNRLN